MKSRIFLGVALAMAAAACAQPELAQWGNLRGLRVDGQLAAFETSLRLVGDDGAVLARTAHYAHKSAYTRAGAAQRVAVQLGDVACTEVVEATGPDSARLTVEMTAPAALAGNGIVAIDLPRAEFAGGRIEWVEPGGSAESVDALTSGGPAATRHCSGLRVVGPARSLDIRCDALLPLEVIATGEGVLRISLPVLVRPVPAGRTAALTVNLRVAGEMDQAPANVVLDATRPGAAFAGVGGNFRLQFPASDPAIIDFLLANIPVTWTRIALWWRDWDPEEGTDPLAAARAGKVTARIRAQLALARRLAARGLPVIVSVWDPPAWANRPGPRPAGLYTDPVNPAQGERMASSIAAYLQFLKESTGVEAALFSFNEPDLGLIPEPAVHLALIKQIGRACRARGLATRQLLADTSNATEKSLGYVRAAFDDPEARACLGAVGFHSWGGCEDENLRAWGAAARQLGLPLLLTEGGPDSEAHRHPDLFLEPAYALDEIELYVRICALAQPATIMHWQLTADYSLLKGGGAYGHAGPLEPTQRYWNFRQLGTTTPRGALALPASCDRAGVTVAAFGDLARGAYVVHLVNNGARRPAVLTGLPAGVKHLRVLAAGADPAAAADVAVTACRAEVMLAPASFTSVVGAVEEAAGP